MATIGKDKIRAVMSLTGSPPPSIEQLEAASQSFVGGELVFINSASGLLTEIASDTPGNIYGVAIDDASGTTSTPRNVWMAHPETLFEANMLGTGAADHVLVQLDIGRVMGIQRVTADSKVYLNSAIQGGTSGYVFVHRVARGSAIGDTNARVLFSFLPKFAQDLATS